MLFLITLLAALQLALAGDNQQCPFAIGKVPFDGERYEGDWYVIGQTPIFGRKLGLRCAKLHYKASNDSYSMTFKGTTVQEDKPFAMKATGRPYWGLPALETSNFQSAFKTLGTSVWSEVFENAILATDYESYALMTTCRSTFNSKTQTFGRSFVASIMSRTPTMEDDTFELLKSILSSQDVDPLDVLMVDQSNCK